MPPQLTNISPEIEGDAAGRGLNFSIVQAKDAIDQALAARLKASAAALDGALPDKSAPGPKGVLDLIKRAWLAFLERRPSAQINLQDLSDRGATACSQAGAVVQKHPRCDPSVRSRSDK